MSTARGLWRGLAAVGLVAVGFALGRQTAVRTETRNSVAASTPPVSAREVLRPGGKPTASAEAEAPTMDWDGKLTRLLFTPAEDLVAVAEGLRDIFLLNPADTLRAWRSLERRPPRDDYIGSVVAAWLWSRQAEHDPKLAPPKGWGLENYPALAAIMGGRADRERIRGALLAGEPVSMRDRRLFFLDEIQRDPVGSFALWLKGYAGDSHLEEISWFHRMMETPEQRAGLLAALSASGMAEAEKAELLARLLAAWTARDPRAAETWLNEPALGAYRERLMAAFADQRVRSDPQNAWSLADGLSPMQRLSARIGAAGILARDDPDTGIRRMAELPPGENREEIIATFGENLAMFNYEKWSAWRDSLSPREQERVNEAAFESWLDAEPDAALAWMAKVPPGPVKRALVSEFASRFSRDEPAAVATWLKTLPNADDRLTALMAGLRSLPDDDHEKQLILLEAMQ